MRVEETAVEDLEEFWERLDGPLGDALRMAGAIVKQQVHAKGLEVSDLPPNEIIDLLHSAFQEAAPSSYKHVDRAKMQEAIDALADIFAEVRIDYAGNAASTGTMN